ncbi:MAG TPA: TetR/AcrR family transcriptional regulator [Symbiobacteriaceae bacterium]|nr:TetR/AcrR family transcriptional regulator [Symbiobacteriaceae bacterium]
MPRRPEQNEVIRQAQHKAILTAALPLFARGGIDGTPVSQIAKAAGVAHGTVFLYFPTKEDLAAEVLTHFLSQHLEQLLSALEPPGSPLDRLKTFTRFALGLMKEENNLVLLAANIKAQRDRFRDLAPHLSAFAHSLTNEVAKIIREGQAAGELGPGTPEVTAWAFFTLLQGIPVTFNGPTEGNPFWDALIDRAMRIFGPVPQQ